MQRFSTPNLQVVQGSTIYHIQKLRKTFSLEPAREKELQSYTRKKSGKLYLKSGKHSPLKPPERNIGCWHFGFYLLTHSRFLTYRTIKIMNVFIVLFKPLELWQFVTVAIKNEYNIRNSELFGGRKRSPWVSEVMFWWTAAIQMAIQQLEIRTGSPEMHQN